MFPGSRCETFHSSMLLEVGSMAEPAVLEVRGVVKSFGDVAAVRDVSFALHAGEVHALVGENGAGKSTIVKMLAGVHQPDAGTLTIDGAPVELASPADAL